MTTGLTDTNIVAPLAVSSEEAKSIDWNKCPVVRGLKKVWEAVCDFFIWLNDLCTNRSSTLSDKEIAWLKAAKKTPSPSTSPGSKKDKKHEPEPLEGRVKPVESPLTVKDSNEIKTNTKAEIALEGDKITEVPLPALSPSMKDVSIENARETYHAFSLSPSMKDVSIENARETYHAFVDKTVDLYYEKKVLAQFKKEDLLTEGQPPVKTDKETSTLDSIFQFITENINKVITEVRLEESTLTSTQNLFDQYKALFAPLLGTLDLLEGSQIISEDKQPEIYRLIQWAIGKDEGFSKELSKYLKSNYGAERSQKLVSWLYGDLDENLLSACFSEKEKQLEKDGPEYTAAKADVYNAFKDALLHLSIRQIEAFKDRVKIIEVEFPVYGEAFFKDNGKKIGYQVVDQFISLIEHLDYSKTYQELLQVFYNQTEAVLSTEKTREESIAKEKEALKALGLARTKAIAAEKSAEKSSIEAERKAEERGYSLIQRANNLDETIEYPKDSQKAVEKEALLSFKQNHPNEESQKKWLNQIKEKSKKEAFLSEKKGRAAWLKEDPARTESDAYKEYKNDSLGWIEHISRSAARESYFAYLETTYFLKEKINEGLKNNPPRGTQKEKEAHIAKIREEAKEKLFINAERAFINANGTYQDEWLKMVGDVSADAYYKTLPICHKEIESARSHEIHPTQPKKKHIAIQALEAIQVILMYTSKKKKLKDLQPLKEPHFFEPQARDLIESLLPKQKVHLKGKPEKEYQVEGILSLLDQIEYPKQITDLYEEGLYIYQKIVSDENRDTVKTVCEAVYDMLFEQMETNIVAYIKDLLTHQTEESINSLFKKFTVQENLEEMVITSILPTVQEMLLDSLTRQILAQQTAKYAEYFFSGTSEERKIELKGELNAAIKETIKAGEVERAVFDKTFNALIIEITEKLEDFEANHKGSPPSLERTRAFLELYLKEVEDAGDLPIYGDIAMNLVLKIGKFSSAAESISGFLKGMLSKQITAAMTDFQEGPYHLLNLGTEKIKQDYFSEKAISDLFDLNPNPAPKPKLEGLTEKKEKEIEKTAKLTHDLFWHISSQQGFVTRKAMQWVVGESPTHLTNVLKRIYQQLLGDRLRMENLVVQTQLIVFNALKASAKDITNQTPSSEIERFPSLIPNFIFASNDVKQEEAC